jgi:nucleoside-diphosphate-sugar epimerase
VEARAGLTGGGDIVTILDMTFFAPFGEQAARRRTVLVTGATGVVGSALLPRLSPRHRVIALAHKRITPGGVITVHGDVVHPLLGLTRERYDRLVRHVDVIVHAAAETELGANCFQTNVIGTRHVLDLAEAAGATVHFLSSAYVDRSDVDGAGDYVRSKRMGEGMVRGAVACGLPATIVRPSAVIGDAQTGEVAAFRGLATLAGAVLTSALPLLPMDPDDRIDAVPVDVLARVLASLVDSGQDSGEFWITAGEAALTAARWVEVLTDVGERLGMPVVQPRLLSAETFARLVQPAFLGGTDVVPAPARDLLVRLRPLAEMYAHPRVLPCDLADLPGGTVLALHQVACAVEASASYLAYAKGLAPTLAPPIVVAPGLGNRPALAAVAAVAAMQHAAVA